MIQSFATSKENDVINPFRYPESRKCGTPRPYVKPFIWIFFLELAGCTQATLGALQGTGTEKSPLLEKDWL